MSVDPLAEIVTLLQPSASYSKLVEYGGRWRVRRDIEGKPVFFAVLEGECRVVSSGRPPIIVRQGDFVLSPSTSDHIVESIEAPPHGIAMMPVEIGEGRFRIGPPSEPVNLRMQVGLCSFSSPDAALLVSLLPAMIVARGAPRLALLLQLVGDETRHARPGRELVLERLLEVLLIEALRFGADVTSVPSVRAACRMSVWFPPCAPCMAGLRVVGRLPILPPKRPCRVRLFVRAFIASSGCLRWNTCWRGAWRWPSACCARVNLLSNMSPPRSAMVRQARSAPLLHAMLACRRCAMLGRWLRFSKGGLFSSEFFAHYARLGRTQSLRQFVEG
jgi:hypothetical protein